jgi:hypothetical protein
MSNFMTVDLAMDVLLVAEGLTEEQQTAVDVLHDYFVNNVFEGLEDDGG